MNLKNLTVEDARAWYNSPAYQAALAFAKDRRQGRSLNIRLN